MDADGFFQNFGNTMTRTASDAAFATLAMHESRNVLRDCLGDTGKIDLDRPHAPLLFIGAEKDEIIPADLCEKNAKAYTDEASVSDYVEFKNRGHFIYGQEGWQEVAQTILQWIETRSRGGVQPAGARRTG
jgi:pimeloyl-ACP methyl ester carboxylesterase